MHGSWFIGRSGDGARSVLVTFLVATLACGVSAWAEEPPRLPEGPAGIAVEYPGDIRIEEHPAVLFVEDFENGDLRQIERRWGYSRNRNREVLALDEQVPPGSPGSRSMRMTATRGENTGGELYTTFDEGWEKVHLRFYTRFAADHGVHHHFVALHATKDPPRAPGGGAGQRPGENVSVTIDPALAPRNGYPPLRHQPPGAWMFYVYWPDMRSWQTEAGVPDGRPNPYYGNTYPPPDPGVTVPRGEWIAVEIMFKLNSDPDSHDGEIALWIDGDLVAHFAPGFPDGRHIRDQFWNDPEHRLAEAFEGFRWRRDMDVKINVLRLQHYVSGGSFNRTANYAANNPDFRVNTQQATVWFDHVVLASEYIGPLTPAER